MNRLHSNVSSKAEISLNLESFELKCMSFKLFVCSVILNTNLHISLGAFVAASRLKDTFGAQRQRMSRIVQRYACSLCYI